MSKVSQKSECCRRLLLFCKASGDLSWEATELDALQRRYHILSSAERIRATLEELNGDSLEWEELSDRLWALASLQLEFGELVKLSELEDPTFCQLLLLKYVNDYQSDKTPETFLSPVRSLVTDRHKLSTQLTWSKISRLCDLLKIEVKSFYFTIISIYSYLFPVENGPVGTFGHNSYGVPLY